MKKRMVNKLTGTLFLALALLLIIPGMASAHCDTMDGPVISDAKKAIETENSNYILKWVMPENEDEILEVFNLTMKVRDQGPEARELADQYLFENLVRIHRQGEDAPYTGINPKGTKIAKEVVAADKSIETGNLHAFEGLISDERMPGLQKRFEKVMAAKDFNVNDVDTAREYVEAYVQFTHFAEGEDHGDVHAKEAQEGQDEANDHSEEKHLGEHQSDGHSAEKQQEQGSKKNMDDEEGIKSSTLVPWSLAALFFVTTILGYSRKKKMK